MSLNKLFDTIEEARSTANWQVAFGEPQVIDDRTIIPVARATYGFGLGFGSSTGQPEAEGEAPTEGEGAGGGGGAVARPLGVIVVTPEDVYFEGAMDEGRIAIAGILMAAFSAYQLAKTLRAIFSRA